MTPKIRIAVAFFLVSALWPLQARADHWHHHDHDGHFHFNFGLSLFPDYYDPIYYPAVVTAPAVITAPPLYYQPVLINGMTYYLNNGNYYIYDGYGYQLVQQPVTVINPPPTVYAPQPPPAAYEPPASPSEPQDSFTVNIPNAKGAYTAVVIKRSGNGFKGPQGEYYAEFPKVDQLKVMYGK